MIALSVCDVFFYVEFKETTKLCGVTTWALCLAVKRTMCIVNT